MYDMQCDVCVIIIVPHDNHLTLERYMYYSEEYIMTDSEIIYRSLIYSYSSLLPPSPGFEDLSPTNRVKNNRLAFDISDQHFGISRLLQPTEMERPDKLALFTYLSLFYEFFLNLEPVAEVGF